MLTAQDMVDVNRWVGLPEKLPSPGDTCGRVDKGAVHVEQAVGDVSGRIRVKKKPAYRAST